MRAKVRAESEQGREEKKGEERNRRRASKSFWSNFRCPRKSSPRVFFPKRRDHETLCIYIYIYNTDRNGFQQFEWIGGNRLSSFGINTNVWKVAGFLVV